MLFVYSLISHIIWLLNNGFSIDLYAAVILVDIAVEREGHWMSHWLFELRIKVLTFDWRWSLVQLFELDGFRWNTSAMWRFELIPHQCCWYNLAFAWEPICKIIEKRLARLQQCLCQLSCYMWQPRNLNGSLNLFPQLSIASFDMY